MVCSCFSCLNPVSKEAPYTLETLQREFHINKEVQRQLVEDFIKEMEAGLRGEISSLKMLPTYVNFLPDGNEKGVFYALDIGGTNFRVLRFVFQGQGKFELTDERKFTIPIEAMEAENAEKLFDFLAESIYSLKGHDSEDDRKYGFTFSFPVKQLSIDQGVLIVWTKGFTTKGVEGNEIVGLLMDALKRQEARGAHHFNVSVKALVNDTVGTLASGKYSKPNCVIGIILGTGTNAAYIEKSTNILTLPEEVRNKADEMVVNMEWGAFGDVHAQLPLTEFDKVIDAKSVNPKKQHFEKMISGFYLGEIVRLALVKLTESHHLFTDQNTIIPEIFYKAHTFETRYMSEIEDDDPVTLVSTKRIENELGFKNVTDADRKIIKTVCEAVVERAARLTAVGIVAILRHTNKKGKDVSVGIDGSVYEHHPTFKQRLKRILAKFQYDTEIFLTKDGSGKGAALIACGLEKAK